MSVNADDDGVDVSALDLRTQLRQAQHEAILFRPRPGGHFRTTRDVP